MQALLVAISLSAFGLAQPERDPDSRFERLDENGDGSLSRDELSMLARARFDELDQDDDGTVSRDELREMVAAHRDRLDAEQAPVVSLRRDHRCLRRFPKW